MKLDQFLLVIVVAGLALVSYSTAANRLPDCAGAVTVEPSHQYVVEASSHVLKSLEPHFFGFNIEWVGFQDDLWRDNEVDANVVRAMSAFPGAVYRYPGGTVANHFDWRASMGVAQDRPVQKSVDWKGPLQARFGFLEYLQFVQQVQGQVWLVANLNGDFTGEHALALLASSAYEWAATAKASDTKVLRWELGNELDRDRYRWPAGKYATRATEVARSIRLADPDARFVGMFEDYDAQGPWSARKYNAHVASSLAGLTTDYALHLYYDGRPGGPPVPHRIRHACASLAVAERGGGQTAKLWITEHARWPAGAFDSPQWKKNWHLTHDLGGALAVADMVIAGSQMPAVEGLFLHSLAGTYGPWPLFHRTQAGLTPSTVYWALRVLRDSQLERVLPTSTASNNASGYEGGYDLRASVLTNEFQTRFSVWTVNRSPQAVSVQLRLPKMASQKVKAHMHFLADPNLAANNVLVADRVFPSQAVVDLTFDARGTAMILVPGQSISATSLIRAK